MRGLVLAVAAALIAITSAKEALSDWQYTRWGMSLEELKAVPGVTVSMATPADRENSDRSTGGRAEATASYQTGPWKLTAYFMFANNRLTMVRLQTKGPDANSIIDRVSEIYGQSEKNENVDNGSCYIKTSNYRDIQRNNLVRSQLVRCSITNMTIGTVEYRAIPGPGEL